MKKIEHDEKVGEVNSLEEEIDFQIYNCEINDHILERTKEEAGLIKEKVKEIQKVIDEMDKKIKTAKILEVYAVHSKEEALIEQ